MAVVSNLQHTTSNPQLETSNLQPATSNLQQATCNQSTIRCELCVLIFAGFACPNEIIQAGVKH